MTVNADPPALVAIPRLLYTPVEAAHALGISRSSLYALLARGELPSVRIGNSRRITAAALAAFVDDLCRPNVTPAPYHQNIAPRDWA